GDDHDVGATRVRVVACPKVCRPPYSGRMGEIEYLSFRPYRFDIDEDNLHSGNAVSGEQGCRAANKTPTNTCYLALPNHPSSPPKIQADPLEQISLDLNQRHLNPRFRRCTVGHANESCRATVIRWARAAASRGYSPTRVRVAKTISASAVRVS